MSTPEATAALMEAMAQHGLHPPEIKWTDKIVRFAHPPDKKNDSGWYVAHPDSPEGAGFGAWGTSINETWFNKPSRDDETNGVDLKEQRKEWRAKEKKRQKARDAALEKEWAAGAKRCVTKWNNAKAKPADDRHPYLIQKGISGAGLRQERGTLMIPMKHIVTGKMVSLQFITQAGKKRFAKGTTVKGAYTSIGLAALNKSTVPILYVVEGFATGRTVHEVTGYAVVVAFSKSNLLPVCKALRQKHPKAVLIICADNDRWTEDPPGVPNPGVTEAHKVAAECDAVVAIPDFENVKKGMTDFNDVMLHDGPEKVEYWLKPEHASEAVIIDGPPPPPVDLGPDPEEPPPELDVDGLKPKTWIETAPFQCLGYDHGTFHYVPYETGQITALSTSAHRKEALMLMAPLRWWEATFPSDKGCNWAVAIDALFRAGARAGVYRAERLRGRGCWLEGHGPKVIIHLGDRLLPPGERVYVKPESYRCERNMIYERLARMDGPSKDKALDMTGAKMVMDAFQGLLWHDEASGILMAGWTVLGPICGALPWRPHIWLTGGTGSGKSTVLKNLMLPLLGGSYKHGGMNRFYEGGTTEAGIRQQLRSDALPVMYDEAEKTDMKSDSRLQNVLGLARSASSSEGAETAKGTTHGQAMTFEVRSMFCLASIGGAIRQEADKTRISLLQLKSHEAVGKKERAAHWRGYSPLLNKMTIEVGAELMARTLSWLRDGRLAETISIFRAAGSGLLGDARSGDQYGTLYAGAWTLMSDYVPTAQDARELMGSEDLSEYVMEQVPEGKKALQALLQHREVVQTTNGPKKLAVGQLVDIMTGQEGQAKYEEAAAFLKQVGIRVEAINGEWYILVATSSAWIKNALADTPYGDNVTTALRTLSGVGPGGKIRFHAGLVSHTTRVPLASLVDDNDNE